MNNYVTKNKFNKIEKEFKTEFDSVYEQLGKIDQSFYHKEEIDKFLDLMKGWIYETYTLKVPFIDFISKTFPDFQQSQHKSNQQA